MEVILVPALRGEAARSVGLAVLSCGHGRWTIWRWIGGRWTAVEPEDAVPVVVLRAKFECDLLASLEVIEGSSSGLIIKGGRATELVPDGRTYGYGYDGAFCWVDRRTSDLDGDASGWLGPSILGNAI